MTATCPTLHFKNALQKCYSTVKSIIKPFGSTFRNDAFQSFWSSNLPFRSCIVGTLNSIFSPWNSTFPSYQYCTRPRDSDTNSWDHALGTAKYLSLSDGVCITFQTFPFHFDTNSSSTRYSSKAHAVQVNCCIYSKSNLHNATVQLLQMLTPRFTISKNLHNVCTQASRRGIHTSSVSTSLIARSPSETVGLYPANA